MAGGMFLRRLDGSLIELQETPYATEAELQAMLARYPRLLGDGSGGEPRRWLLITREMGVPRDGSGCDWWSADHLFLDQDGVPTLVEVKRSSDTRARREVVAQMLDYAANAVVYWPVETIRSRFESRCEREGTDPNQSLVEVIDPAVEPVSFWQSVESNLLAGRIRMIFVADRIAPELQRIVEFLNRQMRPAEVLAVELRQYAHEGESTIVPRVIGQTIEAEQRKQIGPRSAGVWTEESVLEAIRTEAGDDVRAAAEAVLAWARRSSLRIRPGAGNFNGSLHVHGIPALGDRPMVVIYAYAKVAVQLSNITKTSSFYLPENRTDLQSRLLALPDIDSRGVELFRQPSVALKSLTTPSDMAQFLATLDWVHARLNESAAIHTQRT
jgi:hypothetical protein